MAREMYLVTVERPKGVSVTEMRNYIAEAVNAMRGSLEPPDDEDNGHPLFPSNLQRVLYSVKRQK